MENRGPKVFDSTRLDAYKRARAYPVDAASREHTAVPPTWAQTLLHFYHGRARTRYSDKHRLEMLKDRKNFNENPRPSAARPNVPFNSSSASVFFFLFFLFSFFRFFVFFFLLRPSLSPTHRRPRLPVSLLLSPLLSLPFLPLSLSLSLLFSFFLFHSLRFGPRAVRCGRTQKIYICWKSKATAVRSPPFRTDGRTDGRTNGRARRVAAALEKKSSDKEKEREEKEVGEREGHRNYLSSRACLFFAWLQTKLIWIEWN